MDNNAAVWAVGTALAVVSVVLTGVGLLMVWLRNTLLAEIQAVRSDLSGEIRTLDARLGGRIDTLSARVDGLSGRVDSLERRFEGAFSYGPPKVAPGS